MGKTYLICLSPTHSAFKVCKAVAEGMGSPAELFDLTLPSDRALFESSAPALGAEDVAILGCPVYGGHMMPLFREVLRKIKARQTPAVLVCTYGNRQADEAMKELYDAASDSGFVPIACGLFVGEHSFNGRIATGRPDAHDLEEARQFGSRIASRPKTPLARDRVPSTSSTMSKLNKGKDTMAAIKGPAADHSLCTRCGRCLDACPTGNLKKDADGYPVIAGTGCLKCRACARVCPVQAIDIKEGSFRLMAGMCMVMFGHRHAGNEEVL